MRIREGYKGNGFLRICKKSGGYLRPAEASGRRPRRLFAHHPLPRGVVDLQRAVVPELFEQDVGHLLVGDFRSEEHTSELQSLV